MADGRHDAVTSAPAHAAAEDVARHSYGRLLAWLAARSGDVAGAEDALADAFAAALADWPRHGVPDRPEAWLMTAARRRLIDAARRRRTRAEAVPPLLQLTEELADLPDADIPDHRLALMFACAHPSLDPAARAPLMLQTVLGFDAATIASAFLTTPAAMSQRLVRAKIKIRQAGIPFRIPERAEMPARLGAVLDAIYAAFSEGWSDPAGTEPARRNLADEAIWLGRLVVALLPEAPEAAGLLALMLYAEARRPARRDAAGGYVPLAAQDPGRWDAAVIEEAEALLRHAGAMADPGRYQLEAAVQSAHVARRFAGHTDWAAIVLLYDALAALTGSPVVAVNRAVALAEAGDPAAGLAALDALADDRRLVTYQPWWAARAALLARTGQATDAAAAYRQAIGLEHDPAVRAFLQTQAAGLGGG